MIMDGVIFQRKKINSSTNTKKTNTYLSPKKINTKETNTSADGYTILALDMHTNVVMVNVNLIPSR